MIRPGKLHHTSIRVADFERSRAFYEGLLGMQQVSRPDLGFPGGWYGLGDGQLHLIQSGKNLFGAGQAPTEQIHDQVGEVLALLFVRVVSSVAVSIQSLLEHV